MKTLHVSGLISSLIIFHLSFTGNAGTEQRTLAHWTFELLEGQIVADASDNGHNAVLRDIAIEPSLWGKAASGAPLIKYLHNSAAVTYALNKPAQVSLCMYSITGTKISTLFDKYERAGLHTFIWNGNDNQGSRIPNGSYLVMLRIDSRSFAGRVTLVR